MEVRLLREFNVPGTVATELTATKPRFVTGTFDAVVPVSSTGDTVIGLNWGDGQGTYAAEVGASVDILLPGAGIVEVELGNTVSSLFAEITHDSVGRGVTAGAGSISHGLAMATGVVGDIIPMLFYGRGTAITDVTASAAELNQLDGAILADMTPGTGISTGTGTICEHRVTKVGGLYKTEIMIDLTGLNSGDADGDIIGKADTANSHIGQILAAVNGTVFAGRMTCFETPAGGEPDIDLYCATEATGAEESAIGDLTETALLTADADWAAGDVKLLTAFPATTKYLYLVASGGATNATYTAGILLIELWGK